MNKKLIALAVAGAMTGPAIAAAADVEIYGKARVSFGVVGNDNDADDTSDSEINVSSHSSRLGFKGSEDLGNGLTAVYQIEGEVDLDDKEKTDITSRNSFVGLAGGFGTVLLGRHDTPYKIATTKMDLFKDTHGDYTGAGVDGTHDARLNNVLAYISPDMGGFTFAGAYVTDLEDDDLDGADPEDHNTAISLAVMGNVGPVYASLAYQSIDNAGGLVDGILGTGATAALAAEDVTVEEDDSFDAIKLGLGYKITEGALVNFIYESTEVGDLDQDNIYLSGKFDVADSTDIRAAYGMRGEAGDLDDTDGTYFAIGAFTKLSKTTELYALYTAVDNDEDNPYPTAHLDKVDSIGGGASALAVGINVNFSSK